jgi:hypothetical protein
MLRFIQENHSRSPFQRREWLRIGGLSGISWALPGLIPRRTAAENSAAASFATQAPGFGKAKSVIIVFASGGQSQIDMWDPKPDAPKEIRGAFATIGTAVPGVRFCEHMPQIAKITDRLCIVRSMAHEDLDHGTAFYLTMTGRYHRRKSGNPLPASDDLPCHGAILQRIRPSEDFPQTAIHLNGPAVVPLIEAPGQFGGLLGKGFDPLTLGDVSRDEVVVPTLLPHNDLSSVRMKSRQSLLAAIERNMRTMERQKLALDKHALYQQAFNMLARQNAREAFDLSKEPASLRDRYGRNRSGQACLLARRLAEAGVPLVTVFLSHRRRRFRDPYQVQDFRSTVFQQRQPALRLPPCNADATFFRTTLPAPTFAPSPISTLPRIFAPAPMRTPRRTLGWRSPEDLPVPPNVTSCKSETSSSMTAVSPMTIDVA